MTPQEQREAARKFYNDWKGKGQENQYTGKFWIDLLQKVFGVEDVMNYIVFEKRVKGEDGNIKRIDGYIPDTKVLIEQKSSGIPLDKPQAGHGGDTPFQQARRYNNYLPHNENAKWIIVSNFEEIWIYDMDKGDAEPLKLRLIDLQTNYDKLNFLVNNEIRKVSLETQISIEAGDIVGKLYNALLAQYKNDKDDEVLKSLNKLCVRLVFCLYAEDADVFRRNLFHDYLERFSAQKARKALIDLFKILNQKPEERDKYLMDDDPLLAMFPYVNGGLFEEDNVEIPPLTDEILSIILVDASENFDWSQISPTIFGGVFESTLNPETREKGGMHYTSVKNIHKVIDPLFLDDLRKEFTNIVKENDVLINEIDKKYKKITEDIFNEAAENSAILDKQTARTSSAYKAAETKRKNVAVKETLHKLEEFQNKLASIKILDPACGSGNFLTETYLSLRKIENRIILYRTELENEKGQIYAFVDPIKVNINQFYGIEINDFAVAVAKTALWIAESQMMKQTEDLIKQDLDFLPLTTNASIVEENALRSDWNDIIRAYDCNYIIGNPPFYGARKMTKAQKKDVEDVFGKEWGKIGDLDYVTCWYKKAADYMKNTKIRAAFVSTNSITQGEAEPILWEPLNKMGISIDFAHKTFRWDSEAKIKAHVHCVIIGFSYLNTQKNKIIYDGSNIIEAPNINGYLIKGDNIYIKSSSVSLYNMPQLGIGNKPIDDGNYLFTKEKMEDFIKTEPEAKRYFRKWIGAEEFIHNKERYCLWLGDCSPEELLRMPRCLERVNAVKDFRLNSSSEGTRKIASKPTRFHVENIPKSEYIVIPRVSSEKRDYIPMGFLTPDILCSDSVLIAPNMTLYNFGVLTSNVHMAWTKAICGRLETRYRYSANIVYNNFPWCKPTEEQRKVIEKTAQNILDARNNHPDSTLADMYGDNMYLFRDLVDAHTENDRAVMNAYGFDYRRMTADQCVERLFEMYQEKIASLGR